MIHRLNLAALPLTFVLLFCLDSSIVWGSDPSAEDLKFFEARIRPLLAAHCADCHGVDEQESELRLDTYAGMLGGGASGPAIVPGKPEESLIFAAISYKDESLRMPPDGKLPEAEIELLRQWILRGAPHPEQSGEPSVKPRRGAIDLSEARNYWAFQPIIRPETSQIADDERVENPIDALILEHLASEGLKPALPTDKRTLIRRATFDLIGLPPTPEEIDAFLADDAPDAFERVVDRLLASQHYGERWGRHWLDVVRYSDSNGLDENQAFVDAWKYRDYVVEALNDDKPFDRFLVEQIAGDLLFAEEPQRIEGASAAQKTDDYTPTSPEEFELLAATGFLTLGPKSVAEADHAKLIMDIIDEQIDTIGQAFLGLTLSCARCHDHKFDPISTEDYYALAGILKSTKTMQQLKRLARYNEHIVATEEEWLAKRRQDEQIAARKQEIDAFIHSANAELAEEDRGLSPAEAEKKYPEETRTRLAKLRAQLVKLQKESALLLSTVMGVQEGTPENVRIHVRGSHLTLGKTVERGVPAVLSPDRPLTIPEAASGRLQLARWLVSADNPLTARVAVNRIWRWHFGSGIVNSVDNFGRLGERPANPKLLDWLASEFISRGWSVKALHKQIMLSDAYQMSSGPVPENVEIDPENRHFWRANVRRMEAEAIRDSLLAVSGLLEESIGGQTTMNQPKWALVFNHESKDATTYDSLRRSIYLPVIRNNLFDGFSLFDYTSADVPTGSRETSTVAPQALFMMNSELMLKSSEALRERLFREVPDDDSRRVIRLYELVLGRVPENYEIERMRAYTAHFEKVLRESGEVGDPWQTAWAAACQSILASNEFLYVR